ncbi:hypothetical protein EE612_000924 [Oryza sativa]|nr:hypothetical protein EE612_000924 [Oryza sativa]
MPLLLGVRVQRGVPRRRRVLGRRGGVPEIPPLGVGQPGELRHQRGVRGLNRLRVVGELRELQLRVRRLHRRDASEQVSQQRILRHIRRHLRRRLRHRHPGHPRRLLLGRIAEERVERIRRAKVTGQLQLAQRRHTRRRRLDGALVLISNHRRRGRIGHTGLSHRGGGGDSVSALAAEQLGEGAGQVGRLLLMRQRVVRRRGRHLRVHVDLERPLVAGGRIPPPASSCSSSSWASTTTTSACGGNGEEWV